MSKARRRKEVYNNREWVKGSESKGKGKEITHMYLLAILVLTRLITLQTKKKKKELFAISMTVSSPIMHIWGHLLHTLTQQNSSKQKKTWRRVEDFPWIFSAIAFHCVVVFFYVFWLKKKFITIVVDISTRFNANKSIIYNSRTDLSSFLIVCVCKNDEKIWILQRVSLDSSNSKSILRQMTWANLMRLMNVVQYIRQERRRKDVF